MEPFLPAIISSFLRKQGSSKSCEIPAFAGTNATGKRTPVPFFVIGKAVAVAG
jgi:hypothetical protein